MIFKQLLIDEMIAQGFELRLLPGRHINEYSWAELISIHPSAMEHVAHLVNGLYCPSLADFEARFTPNLAPLPDEDDYEYDRRINEYVENACFPATTGSSIDLQATTVWVCHNPFVPYLDQYADSQFVIAPMAVIEGVLRGSRNDLATFAPYSDTESIDVWIHRLISSAYAMGAADIEITSHPSAMRVRLHLNGEWSDWLCSIPLTVRGPFLRALCASATPSIDYEPGTTQDFKMERRINGIDTSWRGAIAPAALGDSVTMRMLPSSGRVPTLQELGYCDQAIRMITLACKRRDGLVLVTGGTGQGKTTTLYSVVTGMRDSNRKIFTAEDPVELVIPGTVQMQVRDGSHIEQKYRVTFPGAIRAALRHKPDVLVVGETRDADTAQASVGASRTGHLTFTTLHTGAVYSSVKRLLDLGIESTSLADTLILVMSQILVRKLCPHCREELENGECRRSRAGCTHCGGKGVHGKTVIYEMAYLDDEAREAIIDNTLRKQFARLRDAGLYISKADCINRLLSAGLIDRREAEEVGGV